MSRRGDDTNKNKDGDTVAHAVLGDAFAEPHCQHAAAHKYDDYVNVHNPLLSLEKFGQATDAGDFDTRTAEPFVVDVIFVVAKRQYDTDRADDGKHKSYPTGDFVNFCSTFFAFLRHSFECGNSDRQQLHNNAGVDVRRNAEGEQCTLTERVTGDGVKQTEDVRLRVKTRS